MIARTPWGRMLLALLMLSAAGPAGAGQDREAVLKQRFAARYPELLKLENAGTIGETMGGSVAVVDADRAPTAAVQKLVRAENADRAALYRLLAARIRAGLPEEKRGAVTAATIAARSARRNFERAAPTHFLQVADGTWIRKKDEPRYHRLMQLKDQGVVGETWAGYVAVVAGRTPGAGVRKIVEEENRLRRARYQALAGPGAGATAVEAVARRRGVVAFRGAAGQHFLKTRGGSWHRKKDLPRR